MEKISSNSENTERESTLAIKGRLRQMVDIVYWSNKKTTINPVTSLPKRITPGNTGTPHTESGKSVRVQRNCTGDSA